MLKWRLIIGSLLIAALAVLCTLDVQADRPGIYLAPLAVVFTLLAAQELHGFYRQRGLYPSRWVVYLAPLLPVLASCLLIARPHLMEDCPLGRLGLVVGGLVGGLLLALAGEMLRFGKHHAVESQEAAQSPDSRPTSESSAAGNSNSTTTSDAAAHSSLVNAALAALAILYVGGLMGFFIQLRLLSGGDWGTDGRWGFVAWLSMLVTVKLSDIGQYTAGHLWGRHKMSPRLSPGKTWEGALGGFVFAVGGAILMLGPVAKALGCDSERAFFIWLGGGIAYAVLIAAAGILGDLAESMLKRDAGVKDSSTWLPGLGGVLDMLDSLLMASPVAYACWALGLVGP